MRVTENLLAANLLARSRMALSRFAKYQDQISSGRKIQRPSDDPAVFAKSLSLRSSLREIDAYRDNASSAVTFMSLTESSMAELSDLLSRAKELVVAGINGTTNQTAADSIALEMRGMIESLYLLSNSKVAGRALFAGLDSRSDAYANVKGSAIYQGDTGEIIEELGQGLRVALNLTGPQAFESVRSRLDGSVDLDPAASTITPLGDLKGGAGVSTGLVRITDSSGASVEIDLLSATNLGEVLNGINGAGLGVTASLTADGKSIELTDTAGGASDLLVEDLNEGSLASGLGIAGNSSTGSIVGGDLDPAVTENTPMVHLLKGIGIGAGTWTIRNDSDGVVREATIDPSQANTVGDLLDLIENARTATGEKLGLTARIEGTGIGVESSILHTTITIADTPGGTSARDLGLAGTGAPRDVFALLEAAATAVESLDTDEMNLMLRDLTTAIEQTAGVRGSYGARARQVLNLAANLDDQTVDMTVRLSDVEDADLAFAAMELAKAETVYSATLASGARLFDINLFNFIR